VAFFAALMRPAPAAARPNTYGAADLRDLALVTPDEAVQRLNSDPNGLGTAEAARRLAEVGPNILQERRVTVFDVFLRQVRNPLLLLLLAAALVSGFTGDPTGATIIGLIVALSVGLGFVNEYRSEAAVADLHSRIRHETLVTRAGATTRMSVDALVPGDIVSLRIGDIVPADIRLLHADDFEIDESVLTGESLPTPKSVTPITSPSADLNCCALMGTVVQRGGATGVVVCTGMRTIFGNVAQGLGSPAPETAFQQGLGSFSKFLVGVAAVLTTAIFAINLAYHRPWIDALLFSLAIAIGITPQLLPAIVSVSLASGSRQLARKRVLVKRLVTIEDLGNIQVLFTDKTGTLTRGSIAFDRAVDASGQESVDVLTLGTACVESAGGERGPTGNALDQALLDAAVGDGTPRHQFNQVAALPFDHERQVMSLLGELDGRTLLVTKGAPEAVLSRCSTIPATAQSVLDKLFRSGARVVAVAWRDAGHAQKTLAAADEAGLLLAGFLTFADPPKSDASAALEKLARLGVELKVITGDNGLVAQKVCFDLGLRVAGVVSEQDLEAMGDDELEARIPGITIFARVTPGQKARIIRIARRGGADIGFLGDGVNDAVAMRAADVGISVDAAADVAKDAADIVLLDKDLGVLADGVVEGRRIFANTMKYILMATSSNFGNMFSAAGASLFLSFLPMLPFQVLLNNLLYDTGQLVIPGDNVDADSLARPAAWDIHFVRHFMSVFGPLSSIFDFLTFFVMLDLLHADRSEFRSGWFVESLATQTLVIFLIRTRRVPFFRSRPSRAVMIAPPVLAALGAVLPFSPLAHLLGFSPLPANFFVILVVMVFAYLGLVELAKARFYRRVQGPRAAVAGASRHSSASDRLLRRRRIPFVRYRWPAGLFRPHSTRSTAGDRPPGKRPPTPSPG
jgi:Mg2+-importing ATPase